jgi:protein N-lysine methyltransferase METTL21A
VQECEPLLPFRCGCVLNHNSLELGAGGGLVGLGVAIGCHVDNPICITDQENMLSLMEQNIKLNALESRVVPLVLNW